MKDLTVVTVNFNTKKFTIDCIESVFASTKGINFEMIVVDNASSDGSVAAIKKFKKDKNLKDLRVVVSKKNLGFAGGNNLGIKKADSRYILFLNSDTVVKNNVLSEMVTWMDEHDDVGVSSCALKNSDGSMQGTGGYFPSLIRVFSWMTIQDLPLVDLIIKPFHPMKPKAGSAGSSFYTKKRQLDWVTGAFALVRKEVLDQVGGFDEEYHMYTEEVDLFYRIKKKGWKVYYLPQWSVVHFGGASSTAEFPIIQEYKGIKRFYKKHYPSWQLPVVRFLLKIGALGRIVLFGVLEGKEAAKIYAKAFAEA